MPDDGNGRAGTRGETSGPQDGVNGRPGSANGQAGTNGEGGAPVGPRPAGGASAAPQPARGAQATAQPAGGAPGRVPQGAPGRAPEGAGLARTPAGAPPRHGERRVYLGNGMWETMDGTRVPSTPSAPVPPAAQGRPRQARATYAQPARPHLTHLWPLRVLLTLPLVWGGALAAGLGVYLVVLAATVGDPGMSRITLALCGIGSLLAALVQVLAFGSLLCEQVHGSFTLAVLMVAAAGAVTAAVLAALAFAAVPTLAVAGLLGYAAVVLALSWALAGRPSVSGGLPAQLDVDGSERRRIGVGPSQSQSWNGGAGYRWGGGVGRGWGGGASALGVLGALLLAGVATAVGFAAFSLFAASFVAGQKELGWQDTLFSTSPNGPDGGGVLGAVYVILANLGLAALFGLATWGAARCVGSWRGRIAWRWAATLGVLLVAGLVAWLLDGSLPRL